LGEEVIIAKAGKPVAKLVQVGKATQSRKLGTAKGAFVVPRDFNEPLPKDILESFGK
jgi:antitoxin (DNA-binding transcriptional repressor) of toxin-antitoxin stability system